MNKTMDEWDVREECEQKRARDCRMLAIASMRKGRYEEALAHLQDSLKSESHKDSKSDLCGLLSECYASLGRGQEAADILKEGAKLRFSYDLSWTSRTDGKGRQIRNKMFDEAALAYERAGNFQEALQGHSVMGNIWSGAERRSAIRRCCVGLCMGKFSTLIRCWLPSSTWRL